METFSSNEFWWDNNHWYQSIVVSRIMGPCMHSTKPIQWNGCNSFIPRESHKDHFTKLHSFWWQHFSIFERDSFGVRGLWSGVNVLKLYRFISTIYTLSSLYFECHWFQLVSAWLNALNVQMFRISHSTIRWDSTWQKMLPFTSSPSFISCFIFLSFDICRMRRLRTSKWRKFVEFVLVPVSIPIFISIYIFMKTSKCIHIPVSSRILHGNV